MFEGKNVILHVKTKEELDRLQKSNTIKGLWDLKPELDNSTWKSGIDLLIRKGEFSGRSIRFEGEKKSWYKSRGNDAYNNFEEYEYTNGVCVRVSDGVIEDPEKANIKQAMKQLDSAISAFCDSFKTCKDDCPFYKVSEGDCLIEEIGNTIDNWKIKNLRDNHKIELENVRKEDRIKIDNFIRELLKDDDEVIVKKFTRRMSEV